MLHRDRGALIKAKEKQLREYRLRCTVEQLRREARENRDLNKIDRVSESETYLLDDASKRTKRICGADLKVPGCFCRRVAGAGSTHKGSGYCSMHERGLTVNQHFGLDQMLGKGFGLELRKKVAGIPLSEELLYGVESEIKLLVHLLIYEIQKDEGVADKKEIRDLIAQLARTKQTRSYMDMQQLYTKAELLRYIKIFFDVGKAVMDKPAYLKFAAQLSAVLGQNIEDVEVTVENVN